MAAVPHSNGSRTLRAGVVYALLAYVAWGLAPAYWKQLIALPATEILAWRVLGGVAVALSLLGASGRWRDVARVLSVRRVALTLAVTALLIGANWTLFIWAVNHDRIVDTSLGYFLTPLLNVALGMLFLRERLRPGQLFAVGLAGLGVLRLAVDLGALPWISLALGGSFAMYGLLRKLVPVPSLVGFAAETAILSPFAAVTLVSAQTRGEGLLGGAGALDPWALGFVAGAGVMTAGPLIWFASAARRLPLSTVGLFQYIAPSVSLGLAVAIYGEPYTRVHAEAFACIWVALALTTWDSLRAAAASGAASHELAATNPKE